MSFFVVDDDESMKSRSLETEYFDFIITNKTNQSNKPSFNNGYVFREASIFNSPRVAEEEYFHFEIYSNTFIANRCSESEHGNWIYLLSSPHHFSKVSFNITLKLFFYHLSLLFTHSNKSK